MSISVGGGESYPGRSFSASQLLYAAKRKLEGSTSGGRITTTLNEAEVDALEHDALQVLSFIRSLKNTFAPINRIPPEVLSLIPNYWEDSHKDEALIKLTHVCRGWREIFISRPSLWTRLDCRNVDKTRVYIERSKSSPLEIYLGRINDMFHQEEAFLLAVPHIHRLRTFLASGLITQVLPVLVEHFSCPLPLLDELKISFSGGRAPTLPNELFSGDLSSLRKFSLSGVITSLPWRGLLNLTAFNICCIPKDRILSTQLLDFFESAPHLQHIQLRNSIPDSCDAPAGRVVFLPHLKELSIAAQPAHSILLNHLSIPAGASLRLEFYFSGKESPIPSYLPKSLDNLYNLSHITAVSLCFGSGRRFMWLHGPSGELRILGDWERGSDKRNAGTTEFVGSLRQFDISRTRQLAITLCSYQLPTVSIVTWASHSTLRRMKDLRTLVLAQCKNLVFIHTLNPAKYSSGIVLCPKLEEIILYIKRPDEFHIDELLSMAAERELRGVKLSAITIISSDALSPPKQEVFQLREYVSRVEYKFDDALPEWDALLS